MKVSEVIKKIDETKKDLEFLKTGFPALDNHLDGGFLRKELVIIGGFTGIGKSYLSNQILLNIAFAGFKTALFSLEISNETIVSRMIGSLSNLKSTRVRAGFLKEEEYKELLKARSKLKNHENYIDLFDDLYKLSEITKIIKEIKPEFVVIDFIQNVFADGRDEYSRLSGVSLQLQKLAKECNCCILALSQLSNMAAREGMKKGILEYKGSGNIATVADLGFIIERKESTTFTLGLQKNRRGTSLKKFYFVFKQPGGLIHES